MIIFKQANQLRDYLTNQRANGKTIGFVPTMGALHEGHLTLIRHSRSGSMITVCSIFVNPTQFNNREDFERYPNTIEKDIERLVVEDCDILFLPSVDEIYPADYRKKSYDLGQLEFILEGEYRPGHFQGVCEVVDRLLDMVSPDNLYLGQKDFQQCMVIDRLLKLTNKADQIRLNIIPTVRESSGLAMSSRNLRLNEEEKRRALSIYQALAHIKGQIGTESLIDLEKQAIDQLTNDGFQVDYIRIVNRNTLMTPETTHEPMVALAAATINKVRLIDNLILN